MWMRTLSLNPIGLCKQVEVSSFSTLSENGQKHTFREQDILNTQKGDATMGGSQASLLRIVILAWAQESAHSFL